MSLGARAAVGAAARRLARASVLLTGCAVAAACALAAGCASAGGGGAATGGADAGVSAGRSAEGGLQAQDFVREVSPFPVLDARGRAYEMPFLGGLNLPRPQFVDIDADGDPDLFVHESGPWFWFFENIGTAAAPRFAWRTDRFEDLHIGDWGRFVDLDDDGDYDVVAELPYHHVRLYRNEGTPADARFVADPDSLRDATGKPLYVDRQNIPAFVDVDCNGRLDVFAGRIEGTVTRFQAVAPGSERFAFVQDHFEGIEIIGQIGASGFGGGGVGDGRGTQRHGANALYFADGDGDGDPDLYWGDFFEPGVLLIENVGPSCGAFSYGAEPLPVPTADSLETSGYNAPTLVDLDGDGDLDFLMGVLGGAYNAVRDLADNFYHWERRDDGSLAFRTSRFLDGIDLGAESAPALGDLDGDGDLDLLVGNRIDTDRTDAARLLFFRNEGSATAPSFRLADTLALMDAYHFVPALGDVDGDGDLDLMLGTWNDDVAFFRNTGSAAEPDFVRDTTLSLDIERAGNAAPTLADLDGDGDLDLVVGEATGELTFVRNEGTATAPRFVRVTERLGDIDVGRRAAPVLVDLDGDGRLDLVVGREESGVAAFRNVGPAAAPMFEPHPFTLTLPAYAIPRFADLDGDGRVDVLAGGAGGGLVYFRNPATGTPPP